MFVVLFSFRVAGSSAEVDRGPGRDGELLIACLVTLVEGLFPGHAAGGTGGAYPILLSSRHGLTDLIVAKSHYGVTVGE